MECTGEYNCKCDRCIAKTHPRWCCCSICVRTGYNQKSPKAPEDHEPWCRCGKCVVR